MSCNSHRNLHACHILTSSLQLGSIRLKTSEFSMLPWNFMMCKSKQSGTLLCYISYVTDLMCVKCKTKCNTLCGSKRNKFFSQTVAPYFKLWSSKGCFSEFPHPHSSNSKFSRKDHAEISRRNFWTKSFGAIKILRLWTARVWTHLILCEHRIENSLKILSDAIKKHLTL